MSFKNLEQRFNERVKELYAPAKTKFENGKSSTGRNDDPLIVRRPRDGYWNFAESRSLPIVSAFNDVKRLTLFTASKRGLIFLVKQQLLQTGNTFEQTRLINPLFTIGNAVPFLHLRRNVRPLTGPYGILKRRPSTSYEDVRKIGQLQKSTYDAFDAKGVGGFLKKLLSPITNTVSAFTAKKNVGEHFGYDERGWVKSRPELGSSDSKYTNAKKLVKPGKAPLGGLLGAFNLGFINSMGKFDQGGSIVTRTFLGQTYGPIAKGGSWNGTYTTYLDSTDGEKKWSHGKTESDYLVAGRRIPKPDELVNENGQAVFLETSTTATDKNLVAQYNDSYVLSAIDDRIESKQYVDYGSAERYLSYPSNPTMRDELTETARYLEPTMVPVREANPSFVTAQDEYIRSNALESLQVETPEDIISQYVPYIKYFTGGDGTIRRAATDEISTGTMTNAKDVALDPEGNRRKISYIKDPANAYPTDEISKKLDVQAAYRKINGAIESFDDPIVVSFAMSNDSPIRFRAFIKDLQQSISPRYNEFQYIGRTEKFINYVTSQREISFKLGVIAFGPDEINNVWRRINYLTGLAFPYGFNRGIHQPNIVRLTIGNVVANQPGYITSINTSFDQLAESWDIDAQVPISAQMDIKFIIIEKASKIASSPFYAITEKLKGQFAESTEIPKKLEQTPDANDAPVVSTIKQEAPQSSNSETQTTTDTGNPAVVTPNDTEPVPMYRLQSTNDRKFSI